MSRNNFATTSPVASSLTAYVAANENQLLAKTVFGFETAKVVTTQPGCKQKADIHLLDTTITLNDGICGFDATSYQTISKRQIECNTLSVDVQWCPSNLQNYYAAHLVRIAAGQEVLPFEEKFTADIVAQLGKVCDKLFWQGNKTTGSGNMKKIDGILTIASGASAGSVVTVDVSNTTTYPTKIAQMTKIIETIPAEAYNMGSTMRIYVPKTYLTSLALELVAANLYHFDPGTTPGNALELTFPGTNVVVTGVSGLEGQGQDSYVIATPQDNIFHGCDMEGDEEVFDLWFSQDDRLFKCAIGFNIGAQYAIPEYLVKAKITD